MKQYGVTYINWVTYITIQFPMPYGKILNEKVPNTVKNK